MGSRITDKVLELKYLFIYYYLNSMDKKSSDKYLYNIVIMQNCNSYSENTIYTYYYTKFCFVFVTYFCPSFSKFCPEVRTHNHSTHCVVALRYYTQRLREPA